MKKNQPLGLIVFFLLAFFFTWLHWVPTAAAARGWVDYQPSVALELIAGYGPLLAAVITAGLFGGRRALKDLGSRLVRWRTAPRWYLVVLGLPLLYQGFGLLAYLALSGQPPRPAENPLPLAEVLIFLPMLILGFDGLGEEAGWRGFALPHLLFSRSPLAASLILGLLWGAWHLPYALTPGSFLAETPLALLLANTLALAVLHTWIFHHSGGSALLAILFHAWNNLVSIALRSWLPAAGDLPALLAALAVQWLLVIGVVLFLPPFGLARRARSNPTQPAREQFE